MYMPGPTKAPPSILIIFIIIAEEVRTRAPREQVCVAAMINNTMHEEACNIYNKLCYAVMLEGLLPGYL